ncbi:GATOR complex protein NPRL2 [Anopheles nili]|uniref:GATOR complex protein NPRL2 n=1 Tax=Anopheles nili TaxID=185578 RepID=UPI00237A13CE|nr:GATOR complex protein NPRL2 [Anopheles nili]
MDREQLLYEDGPIRCILLSEFHAIAGSKISCQVPENFVSKEIFDSIRTFIIPKPQLQRCIITINTMGHKVIGYPVLINHVRYQRNAFYFNLCFVCHSWARTVQYEAVVKKLSEYLLMMEEETAFLSNAGKNCIINLFSCILSDLNNRQVATIIEGDTTIYLKIGHLKKDPPVVHDHQVPLLCYGFESSNLDTWDLTTQQLLPFVDGVNHVASISAKADVENQLVKSCIQNLVYYGVMQLLPLLKYSNVYMCTRELQKLTRERFLADDCRRYVQLQYAEKVDKLQLPSLFNILQLYSQMTHGVTLRSLCQRLCPRDNNIDERKLVSFGLQHNLIRCINKYPIFTGSIPTPKHKLYTGVHSFDEICCKTGLTPSLIEQEIDMDSNVTVIWK